MCYIGFLVNRSIINLDRCTCPVFFIVRVSTVVVSSWGFEIGNNVMLVVDPFIWINVYV